MSSFESKRYNSFMNFDKGYCIKILRERFTITRMHASKHPQIPLNISLDFGKEENWFSHNTFKSQLWLGSKLFFLFQLFPVSVNPWDLSPKLSELVIWKNEIKVWTDNDHFIFGFTGANCFNNLLWSGDSCQIISLTGSFISLTNIQVVRGREEHHLRGITDFILEVGGAVVGFKIQTGAHWTHSAKLRINWVSSAQQIYLEWKWRVN